MQKRWWHDKVAYQIYPKSFNDTNGDGIGDIRGIIHKLDYLKELGIDIIWISPIYQSPFVDQGYDISDYYKIDPAFGTMEEFDELLAEAKKRDMYIVMDLVVNHCSDQHEWFQKALADPDGEYGEYFYIREGKDGKPPSNYRSYFGGSVWEQIEGTNKYYLHMFAKEQPDLNWNNPVVKEKIYEMINWWLEKGVAGFRIDAIINIKKDLSFPSYPSDSDDGMVSATKMIDEVEGVGDMLRELKENTFDKYGAFTVAEVFNMKEDELKEFIGDDGHFSTMFDFSQHCLFQGDHNWFHKQEIAFKDWRDVIIEAQEQCQGIGLLANIIENHDEPRGISRYLPDHAQNDLGTKMLGTVSVLLRGIPFIYQGQEIGMKNCRMDNFEEYDDLESKNQYQEAIRSGCTKEEALEACYRNSRDNARTPMQWSDQANAGFTTGKPWIKVNPNYTEINVQAQEKDESSVLNYYRTLVGLRKDPKYLELFTYGDFIPAHGNHEEILAFYRKLGDKKVLVAANFGQEDVTIELEENMSQILLSNTNRSNKVEKNIVLESCEVVVIG